MSHGNDINDQRKHIPFEASHHPTYKRADESISTAHKPSVIAEKFKGDLVCRSVSKGVMRFDVRGS